MNIRTVRNWLSTIFIIGAIVGLIVYFSYNHETGIYIILGSMIFKFVESALRMTFKND